MRHRAAGDHAVDAVEVPRRTAAAVATGRPGASTRRVEARRHHEALGASVRRRAAATRPRAAGGRRGDGRPVVGDALGKALPSRRRSRRSSSPVGRRAAGASADPAGSCARISPRRRHVVAGRSMACRLPPRRKDCRAGAGRVEPADPAPERTRPARSPRWPARRRRRLPTAARALAGSRTHQPAGLHQPRSVGAPAGSTTWPRRWTSTSGCRSGPGRPRSRRRTASRRRAASVASRASPASCGVRIAPIGPG